MCIQTDIGVNYITRINHNLGVEEVLSTLEAEVASKAIT